METATLIGANIGKGVGEAAASILGNEKAVDAIARGATGAVNVGSSAANRVTKTTFGIAEKMLIGSIILILIIILVIGVSLLLNNNMKSGTVMTLLGVGGIGGCIYWLRNPATDSILGKGEDSELNEMEQEIDNYDYDDGDVTVEDVNAENVRKIADILKMELDTNKSEEEIITKIESEKEKIKEIVSSLSDPIKEELLIFVKEIGTTMPNLMLTLTTILE